MRTKRKRFSLTILAIGLSVAALVVAVVSGGTAIYANYRAEIILAKPTCSLIRQRSVEATKYSIVALALSPLLSSRNSSLRNLGELPQLQAELAWASIPETPKYMGYSLCPDLRW
jgi:hypothetical protein